MARAFTTAAVSPPSSKSPSSDSDRLFDAVVFLDTVGPDALKPHNDLARAHLVRWKRVMNTNAQSGWTWTGFLSWAFGPRRLALIALLVNEAKQRSVVLCEAPDAAEVWRQQRGLLREIRSHCESQLLYREADLAGTLVALAVSEEMADWKRVRLRDGCAVLERLIGARLAHMATLLGLGSPPADRLAA